MVKIICDGAAPGGTYRLGYTFACPYTNGKCAVWFDMLRWAQTKKNITREDVISRYPIKDYEIWIELGKACYLTNTLSKNNKKLWNITRYGNSRVEHGLSTMKRVLGPNDFETEVNKPFISSLED